MAGSCGGIITTQWVVVGADTVQVASASEQRRRLTVRANSANVGHIYLTTSPGTGWREGFPLYAGESYTFDGPGAKAALYAVSSGAEGYIAHVLSEGE